MNLEPDPAGAESQPQHSEGDKHPPKRRLALLSLAALGVVYGDIGTSPIYAIRECFVGDFGIGATHDNVFGVLSLVFWALTIIVSIKYLGLILRADNNGEGGAIALTALLLRGRKARGGRLFLASMGLFAASLLYGDGMITPAISVLSAVEGLTVVTSVLEPYVLPLTVSILTLLFLFQRHGTGKVGAIFGPITLIWFVVIAILGIRGIAMHTEIFGAIDPRFGIRFLSGNGKHGFLVLGAVFLVATGAEALYADLGHFGKGPIRAAWFCVAFPALLLNYFGQGALLLEQPGLVDHPFYALAPSWFQIPLVALATLATIIASQAVISGAFSLTRQAIQLGYCPRMRIQYTSSEEIGQVYIPAVNWMLMLATIALVVGFRSSGKLAAAYGVAVTTTMLVTTVLFFTVARERWRWSLWMAALPVTLFLLVDLAFFGANISKILHGAWFPLAIGAFAFLILSTWKKGRSLLEESLARRDMSYEDFVINVTIGADKRMPGKAVFMTRDPDRVPLSLLHNMKHNNVLHEEIALLTVISEEVPRVPREEKVSVEELGNGFYRVLARSGFLESPSVPYYLALARERGLAFEVEETSFFLSRERIRRGKRPPLFAWRESLFTFLLRNALGATAFYQIPAERVIEIGVQVEL